MTLTQLAQKHNLEPESAKAFLREWLDMQQTKAYLKTWNSVGNASMGRKRVDLSPECELWLENMFPEITPLIARPTDLGE
jgi:hypothetical protein